MISIIIPTLNEQKYLPKLLASVKKQGFEDYEIIVADAGSADKTVELARKFGCQVVKGGLPAVGRNRGAEAASGDTLLFLDADVVLPADFLAKSMAEYKERELKIASFLITPEPRTKKHLLTAACFYNGPIRCLEHLLPHAAMAILIERALFEVLAGFDETIKIAEDHDLARRAAKLAKYGLIKAAKIGVSSRRYEKESFTVTYVKYLLAELYMIFKGPVRKELFEYRFNHYETTQTPAVFRLWRRLKRKIF